MAALAPACLPWLAVAGAWLCFGSYAVPMKSRAVVEARVHPVVYQCHKTLWVFLTSHLVLLLEPYEFSPWGIVSGFLWVPSGVASVVAVQNLGVAYAQAVWQVTMIASSFTWGFAILHDEAVHSWAMALAAAACMASGIAGMTLTFNLSRVPKDSSQQPLEHRSVSLLQIRDAEPREQSLCLGLAAAFFVGAWGGACLVPSSYAPFHGLRFVISFGTGALLACVVLAAIYVLVAKLWWRSPLPPLHLRAMALPGFLSGSLWSLGNTLTLYCVASLGQGIGTSLVQSSVVVSGLWGILYYRELRGLPVLCWLLCCLLCLAGAALLSSERRPP